MEVDAQLAKQRLYNNSTLPHSVPRKRGIRLPPDTSRDKFDKAIEELRDKLGSSNIELNDKPLVDGWYMEHP